MLSSILVVDGRCSFGSRVLALAVPLAILERASHSTMLFEVDVWGEDYPSESASPVNS